MVLENTITLWKKQHTLPQQVRTMKRKKEAPVISPRRLRDRELLKRKKEESREKDTYFEQNQTRSKRPRQTRATGGRRGKQVKEPEPQLEPEPTNEPDHKHEQAIEPQHEPEPNIEPNHEDKQATEPHGSELENEPDHEQVTEWQHEFEPEDKLGIGHDVQQEFSQQEPLEHLEHDEDPVVTVTEDETAETYAVHEEADGHFQHEITSLMTGKEKVTEVEPAPLIHPPEVLRFPEQEEHQYYTPLL
ncbi:unnamed protein product [Staurois parvus]|uniref:Hemogen n=1 Tax=Staurois parvus TaxID=386267 RepID=A0ABN9HRI0_9NEOB|nr:unnamed protein product [Staurois parvus]